MSALLLLLAAAAADPAGVPVLAHRVERGDVLSAADFENQPRPAATGALTPAQAAGREAVRPLMAGAVVRAGDLVLPRLVRRGEPVTVAWRQGGLVITAAGRALSAGGLGEPVRVVTTATNRTLDGVVEGSGAVRIP